MIKKDHVWFLKIFRAIRKAIVFAFRMLTATVLGLISIISIIEWSENPIQIHLLALGLISVFVVFHQIVIMTYGNEDIR